MTSYTCLNCKKIANLFCSRCQRVCYCSKECGHQNWPQHKLNCMTNEQTKKFETQIKSKIVNDTNKIILVQLSQPALSYFGASGHIPLYIHYIDPDIYDEYIQQLAPNIYSTETNFAQTKKKIHLLMKSSSDMNIMTYINYMDPNELINSTNNKQSSFTTILFRVF